MVVSIRKRRTLMAIRPSWISSFMASGLFNKKHQIDFLNGIAESFWKTGPKLERFNVLRRAKCLAKFRYVPLCGIYEVYTISFQIFFVWVLLLIVHTWNSSPLRSPPAAMHLLYRSNNFWKAPRKFSYVSMSMTFVTASFITPIVS